MSKNKIYLLVGGGCLLALCAVGALLVGVLYVAPGFADQANPTPEIDIVNVSPSPHPNANDNHMGDPNAPIQIVVYSDFQCPYCDHFYTETEPLLQQYYVDTGKVLFTYRSAGNFVSQNIGGGRTESQDAAAAAYCAEDQGKFWEMHDTLFANNRDVEDQGSFTSSRLTAIAESIDLDMKTFQKCYDSGKYKDRVQEDLNDAIDAGLKGTPFFVITYAVNGATKTDVIHGAEPFKVFQEKLEAILKEIGAQ